MATTVILLKKAAISSTLLLSLLASTQVMAQSSTPSNQSTQSPAANNTAPGTAGTRSNNGTTPGTEGSSGVNSRPGDRSSVTPGTSGGGEAIPDSNVNSATPLGKVPRDGTPKLPPRTNDPATLPRGNTLDRELRNASPPSANGPAVPNTSTTPNNNTAPPSSR